MFRGLSVCLAVVACGCCEPALQTSERESETGFVSIPTQSYQLLDGELTSGGAALFYSYQPTTSDDEPAPLFVVTAGGPGGPVLLLAHQIDQLRAVGHVLHIDARNSGFSYVTDPDSTTTATRAARFGPGDYNVFRDAMDVAWVLFDYWRRHPDDVHRDVYFVAESYGGARTAVLLDLFLSAGEYAPLKRPFYSTALQDRLESHLIARFGEVPSATAAAQGFRGQILLQAIIAGELQDQIAGTLFEKPNSILDQLADATGTSFVRCAQREPPCDAFDNAHAFIANIGRSRYDYRQPASWLDSILATAETVASEPESLAATFGTSTEDLLATLGNRDVNAFRFAAPADKRPTTLDQSLPSLPAWDARFVALHTDLFAVFQGEAVRALDADPDATVLPGLFVSNFRVAATMVTRAGYDLHVFAPALPGVLEQMPGIASVTEGPEPQTFSVVFEDGGTRSLYAPIFATSHAIGHDDPMGLVNTIAEFVAKNRL